MISSGVVPKYWTDAEGRAAALVAEIVTLPIPLDVTSGTPAIIKHGLGRQIAGWLVIWQTAACQFYVQDPHRDTSQELVLIPNATCSVRLVLL